MLDTTTRYPVRVYDHNRSTTVDALRSLVVESALVIGLNGVADYTIMRTPGNDRELTVGFLFTEGMIARVQSILTIRECPESPHSIVVETSEACAVPVKRNLVVSSSCGLCGRADMDALLEMLGRVTEGIQVAHTILYDISKRVFHEQGLFNATGATHAAALFDEQGEILAVREDVGRHNAVDKVIGAALLKGRPTTKMGIFLSGRASLELVVKAARAGISIMVSVSAPTHAAVSMADKLGIALVGFARESGFTVYTHPERIDFSGLAAKDLHVSSLIATDEAVELETLLAA